MFERIGLRIVYDASLKLHGKSLNKSLENIPTKHTDLFSVLLQFRAYKVALIADIEKAFFTIGVKDTDPDALRFLWVEDPTDSFLKIKEKRFTRVCLELLVVWAFRRNDKSSPTGIQKSNARSYQED